MPHNQLPPKLVVQNGTRRALPSLLGGWGLAALDWLGLDSQLLVRSWAGHASSELSGQGAS